MSNLTEEKKIEYWPIAKPKTYESNTRTHSPDQVSKIVKSISEFGFTNPILVDENDIIIAGHGRLEAAKTMELDKVPVIILKGLSQDQRRAYRIADNRLALDAGWDAELLGQELQVLEAAVYDLSLTGFEDDEINEYLGRAPLTEGLTDEDSVPENVEAITKKGDLWILGNHRVLCGDSTKKKDVNKLMDGATADLIFTDPPYGVAYVGKTKDSMTIQNDELDGDELVQFLKSAFEAWPARPGTSFYVCSPAGKSEFYFRQVLTTDLIRQCLVWNKNVMVMGRQDYQWKHESILYGWIPGAAHFFINDRTQTTVWDVAKPSANREHPTMKPVELITKAIGNSSRAGNVVFDGFLGSGSTLIACEQSNRRCYGLELDPKYCSVIIKRWEEFSGQKAKKA